MKGNRTGVIKLYLKSSWKNCRGKTTIIAFSKLIKFDHTSKWSIHNLESVLENEIHKILRDTTGSLNLGQNSSTKKKRTCWIVDFAVLVDHRVKQKECEKRDKHLDIARELKKTVEHEGDGGTIYQPLRSGRIWHKVNFKRSLTCLNSEFSFS